METRSLKRLLTLASALTITLTGLTVATATPVLANGTYDNAIIADDGLSHLGQNGGSCKTFANNMVKAASGNTQNPGGYQSGWAALGTEVTSANAVKGDIIQVTPAGSTDSTAESIYTSHMNANGTSPAAYNLHTAIIVSNDGSNSFTVIDSNFSNPQDYIVRKHSFNPYSWTGSIVKIWRLGAASSPGSYSDGTFVRASDTGRVYTMAGGSPMYVTSLSNVPWTGSYVSLTQSQIDAMPMYPADGTAIRGYTTGGIYVVAGGFPFGVSSLANIPNPGWTEVDASTISNGLRSQPADGTVIRNYTTGGIYVVSGDAPMPVHSLSAIPSTTWTNIDGWAIANQMRTYPTDGSTFVDYSTGTVYVVAGGAPMATNSFGNIPPVTSLPYIDDWAVTNYLPAYPADGTVIRDYNSGSISVVAGGSALGISSLTHVPYQGWVNIDGTYATANQLRSYPASGTYIKGYQSQEEFVSNGSTVTRVTTTPLPAATAVDDWAITNQLGGTL